MVPDQKIVFLMTYDYECVLRQAGLNKLCDMNGDSCKPLKAPAGIGLLGRRALG